MSLRVISGTAKGRKLRDVPGDTTRPVTDMVKQALFNILAGDVVDAAWWDLFGGTGAVGIEALSRGAAFVRFSDLGRAAVETIRWNLDHCRFSARAEVRRGDAFAMLASPPDRAFDYVYIAPPQFKEMWSQALHALDANPGWLSEGAWVIAQIHPKEYQELALKNLEEFDERKYGSTLLVFYEKCSPSGQGNGCQRIDSG
ncbi:MAG: 16S rRNA (guanine(966)-N(2))-methyltransferase RsmD [Anaerolineales bacterium]|nr:16S rRNA (guanine(966)-N(2))-methyltransferase RsmD [Anaerolineales bacterium]